MTHKDQEIDRTARKSAKDLVNSRMGGMPQCDDPQRSRNRSNSEKVRKRSGGLKDGGMPQCKIVTKIRRRMSSNKTL